MRILVVYDSAFGNTERVARSIADALADAGTVVVRSVAEAAAVPLDAAAVPLDAAAVPLDAAAVPLDAAAVPLDAAAIDLLVVGGPTQRHGASPALVAWLGELPVDGLAGVATAVFDTRYRMAKLISGSAGESVTRWLRRAGCRPIVPPESFFVAEDAPPEGGERRHELELLEPGEIERAAAWARALLDAG